MSWYQIFENRKKIQCRKTSIKRFRRLLEHELQNARRLLETGVYSRTGIYKNTGMQTRFVQRRESYPSVRSSVSPPVCLSNA